MDDNITIREASTADVDAVLALLPLLASFPLATDRNPRDLWRHDAELLKKWARGDTDNCFVHLAHDSDEKLAGAVITSFRPELLSGEPSAHVEVLVVNPDFRRQGIGERLLQASESLSKEKGASSLTLHVFGSNEKARRLYQRVGFSEELLRCRKSLV